MNYMCNDNNNLEKPLIKNIQNSIVYVRQESSKVQGSTSTKNVRSDKKQATEKHKKTKQSRKKNTSTDNQPPTTKRKRK